MLRAKDVTGKAFLTHGAMSQGIIAHTLFDPEAGQVGRKLTEVPSPEVSFDLNAFTHYSARFGASKSLTFCSRINLRPAKNILGDLLKYRGKSID